MGTLTRARRLGSEEPVPEAIGSLIKAAKRRARCYRTTDDLIAIAYLVAGKLDFATHTEER